MMMTKPTLNRLRNAFSVCNDCGLRYGEPRVDVCTHWYTVCGVCGHLKPCCDTRDYGFLMKGRRELGEK